MKDVLKTNQIVKQQSQPKRPDMDEVVEAPSISEAAETSPLSQADLEFLAKSQNVNPQSQQPDAEEETKFNNELQSEIDSINASLKRINGLVSEKKQKQQQMSISQH